ncbi:hypothetical protein BDW66DRAFT_124202 [Aspergillus desertorum]
MHQFLVTGRTPSSTANSPPVRPPGHGYTTAAHAGSRVAVILYSQFTELTSTSW